MEDNINGEIETDIILLTEKPATDKTDENTNLNDEQSAKIKITPLPVQPRFKKIGRLILAIFIVGLLMAVWHYLPLIGENLIADDLPRKSDAIILLMGDINVRPMQAFDLYHNNYADKIVMVQNADPQNYTPNDLGMGLLQEPANTIKIGNNNYIPSSAFVVLPGPALNIEDEAFYFCKYLQQNQDINSVILVTSKCESKFAKKLFNQALKSLGRQISLISCPSAYDTFNASGWSNNQKDKALVKSGYGKLLKYYLLDQFTMKT